MTKAEELLKVIQMEFGDVNIDKAYADTDTLGFSYGEDFAVLGADAPEWGAVKTTDSLRRNLYFRLLARQEETFFSRFQYPKTLITEAHQTGAAVTGAMPRDYDRVIIGGDGYLAVVFIFGEYVDEPLPHMLAVYYKTAMATVPEATIKSEVLTRIKALFRLMGTDPDTHLHFKPMSAQLSDTDELTLFATQFVTNSGMDVLLVDKLPKYLMVDDHDPKKTLLKSIAVNMYQFIFPANENQGSEVATLSCVLTAARLAPEVLADVKGPTATTTSSSLFGNYDSEPELDHCYTDEEGYSTDSQFNSDVESIMGLRAIEVRN